MGFPVITGSRYLGDPSDLVFTPGLTPYIVILSFGGIGVGDAGLELGYVAPNGSYIAKQDLHNPNLWVWEPEHGPPGPSDVYGCEDHPAIRANYAHWHVQAHICELILICYKAEIAFLFNPEDPEPFAFENGFVDPRYEFYGGSGSIHTIGTGTGTFSLLEFAEKFGFDTQSQARIEPYPVEYGVAGCRISRRADKSRIYIRQERS